jgi:hypothetical protein
MQWTDIYLRSASATGAAETTERIEARAATLKNFILNLRFEWTNYGRIK